MTTSAPIVCAILSFSGITSDAMLQQHKQVSKLAGEVGVRSGRSATGAQATRKSDTKQSGAKQNQHNANQGTRSSISNASNDNGTHMRFAPIALATPIAHRPIGPQPASANGGKLRENQGEQLALHKTNSRRRGLVADWRTSDENGVALDFNLLARVMRHAKRCTAKAQNLVSGSWKQGTVIGGLRSSRQANLLSRSVRSLYANLAGTIVYCDMPAKQHHDNVQAASVLR